MLMLRLERGNKSLRIFLFVFPFTRQCQKARNARKGLQTLK